MSVSSSPNRPDAGMGDLCSEVVVRSPMAHVRATDTHDQNFRATRVRKFLTCHLLRRWLLMYRRVQNEFDEHGCDSQMGQLEQSSCTPTEYHTSWTKGTSGVDTRVCLGLESTRFWSPLSNCLYRLDAE